VAAKSFRKRPGIYPRVEVLESRIQGQGAFVSALVAKGDVVTIWGGTGFAAVQIAREEARQHSYGHIGDGLFLGTSASQPFCSTLLPPHTHIPQIHRLGVLCPSLCERSVPLVRCTKIPRACPSAISPLVHVVEATHLAGDHVHIYLSEGRVGAGAGHQADVPRDWTKELGP
jgi:hypothetical protein